MELLSEIQHNLKHGYAQKMMKISCLPESYPAWTIRTSDWYGIVVPMKEKIVFSENFTNARIWTQNDMMINGKITDCLLLTCKEPDLRDSFAVVCAQFAEPGENGKKREELIASPEAWWRKWKDLLGNASQNKESYPELAEMIVAAKLYEKGYRVNWNGLDGSVDDIYTDHGRFEVKSTTDRYGYKVTISSPYQMDHPDTTLDLVFCRFERTESEDGLSVDEMAETLNLYGFDCVKTENMLSKKGLEKGKTARKKKYNLIEMKVYSVNEQFPSIKASSFKGDVIPSGITAIKYDVDLSGMDSRSEL